ncbi:hypothetical protein C2G38_2205081 [Gigaspora rosea]|uniref:Uncharacterized protein n=1 Tax=Gigaspora rosea TaxID=44941 RepID=A0A397UTL3_9GLOM|nr:hypothetical protein C2G38_2205081 [Gigaspora rosea]
MRDIFRFFLYFITNIFFPDAFYRKRLVIVIGVIVIEVIIVEVVVTVEVVVVGVVIIGVIVKKSLKSMLNRDWMILIFLDLFGTFVPGKYGR